MRKTRRLFRLASVYALTTAVWSGAFAALSAAEVPAIPPVSQFAPVGDLLKQVDFFIGRTAESLADGREFDEASQSRALKDANTLAALALLLAQHDQDFPEKPGMPALVKASQALAAAGANSAEARLALSQLQAARAGKVNGDPGMVRWEKVAELKSLMKQVPLVHTGLKRGVEPNRLARQQQQAAGQSATLAAIAQASLLDTEWIQSPEDLAAWTRFCSEMRDSAGEVNSAIHALDQARLAEGMKRMTQSCDDCHARFRTH